MRTNEPTPSTFMPDPSAMDISDEKFKELSDQALTMVESVGLGGKTKSLMPVMFVHYRKLVEGNMLSDIESTVVGIAQDFTNSEQKRTIPNHGFVRVPGHRNHYPDITVLVNGRPGNHYAFFPVRVLAGHWKIV